MGLGLETITTPCLSHPATLEGRRRGRPWQAEATLYRGASSVPSPGWPAAAGSPATTSACPRRWPASTSSPPPASCSGAPETWPWSVTRSNPSLDGDRHSPAEINVKVAFVSKLLDGTLGPHGEVIALSDRRDLPPLRINSEVAEVELRHVVMVAGIVTHSLSPQL